MENHEHKYKEGSHLCLLCGKHDGYDRNCGFEYCKCQD